MMLSENISTDQLGLKLTNFEGNFVANVRDEMSLGLEAIPEPVLS